MKNCAHCYRLMSCSGISASFRCVRCNKTVSRDLTAKERVTVDKYQLAMQKQGRDIHKTYHAWMRLVNRHKGNPSSLMDAAEGFHKRHRGRTFLITVDDRMHMTSRLLIITHETADSFMGITAVTLTQADTKIHECFLYPHSIDKLIDALAVIKSRTYKRGREPRLNIEYKQGD